MSLFSDTDPRFRRLSLKVLVFAVLGVIAGVALLVMLAIQQGFFAAHTELKSEAPNGAELRPGMEVKLSGFKIGELKSVTLNERARVDLLISIEDQYMGWIKADSILSTAREGLIGDPYLTVTAGSTTLEPLRAGDNLSYVPTPGLADIAQDVRNRTLPVIDGMTALLNYLNDPKGEFRGSLAELKTLAAELRETRRQVDKLLANVDQLAREDLRRTLANADKTLATVDQQITAISQRTDVSLAKLDEATASAKITAEDASKAISTASPKIDRLLDDTDKAVRDSRKLMDGASKRWPFKGGKAPEDEAVPATPEIPETEKAAQ